MKSSKIDRIVSVVVIGTCLIKAVLYGGSKPPSATNEPPDDASSPTNAPMLVGRVAPRPPEMDLTFHNPAAKGLAALPMMSSLPPSTSTLNLNLLTNWTARGAYCDWRRVDFPSSFAFPHGTNMLTGVTLMAYGEIRATLHSTPTPSIYTLPAVLAIEPNVSSVTHGLTPSNSYLFAWHNACVERCATNRADASIKLFRSGEVVTTFNGVVGRVAPRPPEGYIGIGQDDDWIRATFPDVADNILALGYESWLTDEWVGVNEQNGRYLARVTIDPSAFSQSPIPNSQSPIYLTCGPYRVNVVASGTYSFPLEVFDTYRIRTYPTTVPLSIVCDDGYTGEGVSLNVQLSGGQPNRPRLLAAPSQPPSDPYDYTLTTTPCLIVRPSRVSRNEADGTRVSFWCNMANVTRRFVRTAAREFYLNFCWPSDAEIEAAEDDLENEVDAEDDSMEVVYQCPKGECSGWIYIEGYDDEDGDDDDDEREDASIYSGPAWQTSYSNDCLVCHLTVTTTDGSTATHEESGAAILAEGQSAEVSVYFETTEYGGDVYDDEVEWQVLVNGTAAMSGSASVSSSSGGLMATQHFDAPSGDVLRLRATGRARNVGDALRQSCVRIVITAIDGGDAPGQP